MAKITFNEDEPVVVPEPQQKVIQNNIDDSSDDDEAPTAISLNTGKTAILSKLQAEKEAAVKIATEEKEKRRKKEQFLKEQKEGSKREMKQLLMKEKKMKLEKEYAQKMERRQQKLLANEIATDIAVMDGKKVNLLPDNLLMEAKLEEEQESKKRKHITEAEFDALLLLQEEEEKKKSLKKRNIKAGRQVGEYTVKVINNRPKLSKPDPSILDFRNKHLHRSEIFRKDAVNNISQGRQGAALTFKRSSK
ncbi:hypothetical protein BDB01DRAFT_724982 [Pilobolus umbonatus]|nr:hypothetical protein BDB01DRAFT_724982 [Pilobolus umbonatus]